MPRCTNCLKGILDRQNYNAALAGTLVSLFYTGEKVGGESIVGPSGRSYIFSKSRPEIVVDGGDVEALLKLGMFRT